MSEDVALEAHEHQEHAEHAAHEGDGFLRQVSITIAILAVISATISSLESNESAAAVSEGAVSVLHQDKATDQWAYYQAKSIKSQMYALAADAGGAKAQGYRDDSDREKKEEQDVRKVAEHEEDLTKEAVGAQDKHEHRHHVLGISETISHVAIAIATIAIITRQKWPWVTSIALGAAGIVAAAYAYF